MAKPPKLGSLAELDTLRRQLAERSRQLAAQKARDRAAADQLTRDRRVFEEAMQGVQRLAPRIRAGGARARPAPVPLQRELDERAALAQSLSDELDIERLLDTDEALSYRQPGVGADVVNRLRRGHWMIQAELDLHGLRSDDAREALVQFLAQALRRGQRCVRIIHGKGLGSVNRTPVLKDKVLRWLIQRVEVIAFCQAPPADGGSGALLVLLRGA